MTIFQHLRPSFVILPMSLVVTAMPLQAQRLPLPKNLISLLSPEGQILLQKSEAQADYIPLMSQFVSQKNAAFCGVASVVMVLNALEVPVQVTSPWPQSYFTQDNIFNEKTEKVIPRYLIARQGMTLAELSYLIATYPVQVETLYGGDISIQQFRQIIRDNLENSNNFVLINYLRRTIGQERGGHISPIAAYNEESDQFLVLDVSRYKYPPVWVNTKTLWESTNTIDPVSKKTRGVVLISRPSET
ncbi:glutathione gamma-glutamylcysteinyltransferase [Hydrocoleum sp. CS-953]|uniref:phytochelatin synthase family protein n=1 Tax=Hydrocoleum sp. CS-953 TaxID=1671698 RepID=UPI000BC871C6|nr:phytochelatin synthase family protein [Hydrocoleum sp. CS-953]OZH53057.1 glutathione gamma-glutamylcysteinyltransferase [Hydrocoleum sp. CS-953]